MQILARALGAAGDRAQDRGTSRKCGITSPATFPTPQLKSGPALTGELKVQHSDLLIFNLSMEKTSDILVFFFFWKWRCKISKSPPPSWFLHSNIKTVS